MFLNLVTRRAFVNSLHKASAQTNEIAYDNATIAQVSISRWHYSKCKFCPSAVLKLAHGAQTAEPLEIIGDVLSAVVLHHLPQRGDDQ